MNNELIAAEKAAKDALDDLQKARRQADDLDDRMAAGEDVSAEDLAVQPARLRVAEARHAAAERHLRTVEDALPLPANPAVLVDANLRNAVAEIPSAVNAVEKAEAGVTRAQHALATAEGKRNAAVERLEAQKASDPGRAIHAAKILANSGAVVSNIEVTSSTETPKRSTLPLLRITPEASNRLRLEYWTKLPTELPPSGEALDLAFRLDGWLNGPLTFDLIEDGEDMQVWESSLTLTPRSVIGYAESEDHHGEQNEKLTDKLDLSAYHAALRDGDKITVYSTEQHAPLAHEVTSTGLHKVTSGMAITSYTKGAKPLAKGSRANLALAGAIAELVGCGDWTVGVVSAVEVLDGMPKWAGRIAVDMPPAQDRIVRYVEVVSVFRVPEGRELRPDAFGLVDVAA